MTTTLRLTTLLALLAFVACDSDAPRPVVPSAPPATVAAAVSATAPLAPDATKPTPLPPGLPPLPSASLPPGHPPLGQGAGFEMAQPPKDAGSGALAWTTPKGWVSETPSSAMRRAQYKVPGSGGEAECVVFYFGPGQGGDATSNADRWASQFRQPDGKDPRSAMKTRQVTASGMTILMVEVAGTYVGGMGGTAAGERPGYLLLGAIAQGPDANWFFKLIGPEATVTAQRAAFERMVSSLKKGA